MKIKKLQKNLIINSCESVEIINYHSPHELMYEGDFGELPEDFKNHKVELISTTWDKKLELFVSGGDKDATD